MKHLAISIPTPCHQKFESFAPTAKGGFCTSCRKEVIDFTTWTDERLIAWFASNGHGSKVCGKLNVNQLRTFQTPSRRSRWSMTLSAVLFSLVMLFSQRTTAQPGRQVVLTEQIEEEELRGNSGQVDTLLVSGVVRDKDGPIPGVNVVRKGTTQGVVTDAEGRYSLTITDPRPGETLVLSFIGCLVKEVAAVHSNDLNVTMVYDRVALGETVIIMGGICARRSSARVLRWVDGRWVVE